MTQPYVEVRRKNLGEQFTVVDPKTRFVLHWHRPGSRLPVRVFNWPDFFEITEEDIQKAAVLQRTKVYAADGPVAVLTDINKKGVLYAYPMSRWERLKAWVKRQINKLKGVFA